MAARRVHLNFNSASAVSSQYIIPISRYSAVVVMRCSCACSRLPVRAGKACRGRWQWATASEPLVRPGVERGALLREHDQSFLGIGAPLAHDDHALRGFERGLASEARREIEEELRDPGSRVRDSREPWSAYAKSHARAASLRGSRVTP